MIDPRLQADEDLRHLRETVNDLSRRVGALEAALAPPAEPVAATPLPRRRVDTGWLATVGRTFVVFGGAYLLRALTESGTLSLGSGVWLGLTYAFIWLLFAWRARGLSATLHGLSALLIGVPLIVEASLRFGYFTAGPSTATLASMAMVALIVGWLRHDPVITGLAAAGTIIGAFTLAIGFERFVLFGTIVILIGAVSLWIADDCDWAWLRWLTALSSDFMVLPVLLRALDVPPREPLFVAQAMHGVLIAVYVGTIVIRILLQDRPVRAFDMVQTALVMTIGLTGATAISHAGGVNAQTIAVGAVIAGAVTYVQTFRTVAPRFGLGAEFYYFGTTALALTLVGLSLLLSFPARPVVVALAALAAIVIGWRWQHPMLTLQGSIAAIVASAQGGLVAFSARAWLTSDPVWPADLLPMMLVLVAVALALLIPPAVRDTASRMLPAIARVGLSVALVVSVSSILVALLTPIVTGRPADPGVLATMRTVVLVIAVLALSWIGGSPKFSEMRWLAYAGVAAGAFKLFAEDFRVSRPATLFIALAAYGTALIVLPRIVRRRPASFH